MSIISLTDLKKKFENGDKPDEQAFVDLIDTLSGQNKVERQPTVNLTYNSGTVEWNMQNFQIPQAEFIMPSSTELSFQLKLLNKKDGAWATLILKQGTEGDVVIDFRNNNTYIEESSADSNSQVSIAGASAGDIHLITFYIWDDNGTFRILIDTKKTLGAI